MLATSDEPVCVVRADRAARAGAADGLAPSEEAARRRPARARAARQVGLFLVEARRRREARGGRRPERSVLLMTTTADELREEVRRRYAESARAVTEGTAAAAAAARAAPDREDRSEVRRGALRRRAARRAAGGGVARLARLRQPDRGRRPARGRDGARPRLGRRHRRDPLGEARRPDRHRLRARHDRRDARARAAERRARPASTNVALPQGRDRGDPAARRLGRRRDLELRDQPLDRQAGGADRDRPRAEAGRPDRDQRRRRRGPPHARASAPSAARYVGCIAGALSKGEYEAGLEAAGFEEVSVEFTHQVADGMHGAIVKAVKTREPERKACR